MTITLFSMISCFELTCEMCVFTDCFYRIVDLVFTRKSLVLCPVWAYVNTTMCSLHCYIVAQLAKID